MHRHRYSERRKGERGGEGGSICIQIQRDGVGRRRAKCLETDAKRGRGERELRGQTQREGGVKERGGERDVHRHIEGE